MEKTINEFASEIIAFFSRSIVDRKDLCYRTKFHTGTIWVSGEKHSMITSLKVKQDKKNTVSCFSIQINMIVPRWSEDDHDKSFSTETDSREDLEKTLQIIYEYITNPEVIEEQSRRYKEINHQDIIDCFEGDYISDQLWWL